MAAPGTANDLYDQVERARAATDEVARAATSLHEITTALEQAIIDAQFQLALAQRLITKQCTCAIGTPGRDRR